MTQITDDVREWDAAPLIPYQGQMWVSYSQVGRYTECPRRWAMSKVYEEQRAGVQLVLGSWWHAIRAALNLAQGEADGTLMEGMTPKTLGVKTWWGDPDVELDPGIGAVGILLAAKDHWDRHETSVLATWFKENFTEKYRMPLPHYLKHLLLMWDLYKPSNLGKVLGVEVDLKVDLDGPSGPIRLVGYIDTIDLGEFGVRVIDNKTVGGQIPEDNSRATYEQQLAVYKYAWQRALVDGGDNGPLAQWGDVTEVGYEYVSTRKFAQPVLTKSGKLSATPQYPLDVYLSWVQQMQAEAAATGAEPIDVDQKELAKRSNPEYGETWVSLQTRMASDHLVKAHIQSIVDVTEQMRLTQKRWDRDGIATPLLSDKCVRCPFWGLCADQCEGYTSQDLRDVPDDVLNDLYLKRIR